MQRSQPHQLQVSRRSGGGVSGAAVGVDTGAVVASVALVVVAAMAIYIYTMATVVVLGEADA